MSNNIIIESKKRLHSTLLHPRYLANARKGSSQGRIVIDRMV